MKRKEIKTIIDFTKLITYKHEFLIMNYTLKIIGKTTTLKMIITSTEKKDINYVMKS